VSDLLPSDLAVSGAGLTGVSSFAIMDNVIPYIGSEEEKLQTEPLKILGELSSNKEQIEVADFVVSAQCNRVPVLDGHTGSPMVLREL
jgi:aspartate-semialdehyde dehydrogenase